MYWTVAVEVVAAEIVTGELTVAPLAGEQIVTLGLLPVGVHVV